MDDETKFKIITTTKKIHETLGRIYHILCQLDDAYNKKDSYVTLHKTHLNDYIKFIDNTILEWHNSLLIIQNMFDNGTFEFKMFEKINDLFFHDDQLRKNSKCEIHICIKEFSQMMFNLNMLFFVHADIAFTH